MKKVLFLVTELQKPVGGLHRYSIEMLGAWKKAFESKQTEYEPLPISLRDPAVPLSDLRFCAEYGEFLKKHPKIPV